MTKMQRIVMKFGMFVIGLGENAVSTDELAQRKIFLGHPNGTGVMANDNET